MMGKPIFKKKFKEIDFGHHKLIVKTNKRNKYVLLLQKNGKGSTFFLLGLQDMRLETKRLVFDEIRLYTQNLTTRVTLRVDGASYDYILIPTTSFFTEYIGKEGALCVYEPYTEHSSLRL